MELGMGSGRGWDGVVRELGQGLAGVGIESGTRKCDGMGSDVGSDWDRQGRPVLGEVG